jgi:hypothetical protein
VAASAFAQAHARGLPASPQEQLVVHGSRAARLPMRNWRPGLYLVQLLQEYAGIVTMAATTDHAQKSVLMLSNVRDRSIKLLELPAFSERGVLPDVSAPRCWVGY